MLSHEFGLLKFYDHADMHLIRDISGKHPSCILWLRVMSKIMKHPQIRHIKAICSVLVCFVLDSVFFLGVWLGDLRNDTILVHEMMGVTITERVNITNHVFINT